MWCAAPSPPRKGGPGFLRPGSSASVGAACCVCRPTPVGAWGPISVCGCGTGLGVGGPGPVPCGRARAGEPHVCVDVCEWGLRAGPCCAQAVLLPLTQQRPGDPDGCGGPLGPRKFSSSLKESCGTFGFPLEGGSCSLRPGGVSAWTLVAPSTCYDRRHSLSTSCVQDAAPSALWELDPPTAQRGGRCLIPGSHLWKLRLGGLTWAQVTSREAARQDLDLGSNRAAPPPNAAQGHMQVTGLGTSL